MAVKPVALGLILTWLCLTGTYQGWSVPLLLQLNFILWAAVIIWLARSIRASHPLAHFSQIDRAI